MDFADALQYVRDVKSNLAAGEFRQSYQEFLQTLKQYRHRNIDSSILISTAQTLFRNHPNLLHGFSHFVPSHQSAAMGAEAPAENSCVVFLNQISMRSCTDFLNRVGARFNGGGVYCELLECMCAYSRGEITPDDLHDKVVGLFGKDDDDLVREFVRFSPKFREREGPWKREIDQADQADERGTKRRRISSSGRRVLPPQKFGGDEVKPAAKRGVDRDNEMEDLMCDIDVRIGLLKSVGSSTEDLYDSISKASLPPGDVRLDEHFTAVELACIGRLDRKFLERVDGNLLLEMMMALRKRKVALEREREKIVHKWNKIRQSQ